MRVHSCERVLGWEDLGFTAVNFPPDISPEMCRAGSLGPFASPTRDRGNPAAGGMGPPRPQTGARCGKNSPEGRRHLGPASAAGPQARLPLCPCCGHGSACGRWIGSSSEHSHAIDPQCPAPASWNRRHICHLTDRRTPGGPQVRWQDSGQIADEGSPTAVDAQLGGMGRHRSGDRWHRWAADGKGALKGGRILHAGHGLSVSGCEAGGDGPVGVRAAPRSGPCIHVDQAGMPAARAAANDPGMTRSGAEFDPGHARRVDVFGRGQSRRMAIHLKRMRRSERPISCLSGA